MGQQRKQGRRALGSKELEQATIALKHALLIKLSEGPALTTLVAWTNTGYSQRGLMPISGMEQGTSAHVHSMHWHWHHASARAIFIVVIARDNE